MQHEVGHEYIQTSVSYYAICMAASRFSLGKKSDNS
jgi:hypothetical protein